MVTMPIDPARVLSIQSHVVSGYVGNRAATFPLQTLGYDVDVVNTVQFSNHTGYACVKGQKTTVDTIQAIFDGLRINGLGGYAKILTGYVPGAEALEVVEKEIRSLKEQDPETIYILDPVMGDIGRGLYVSPEVVPVYKRMLRLADIITPNQFEVEILSDTKIVGLPSLRKALWRLHTDLSVPHIAFSSIPLRNATIEKLGLPQPPESYTRLLPSTLPPAYHPVGSGGPDDEVLVCFASSYEGGAMETWAFALPTIDVPFTGTGDLLSALCTAWYGLAPTTSPTSSTMPALAWALSKALLTVQQILLRTYLHMLELEEQSTNPGPDPIEHDATNVTNPEIEIRLRAQQLRRRELRLVQERALISDGGAGWDGRRVDWDTVAATAKE